MRLPYRMLFGEEYTFSMDFSGKIVLSFIEEDNVQRAYFRIRPLLTGEGALTKQDIDALPDDAAEGLQ